MWSYYNINRLQVTGNSSRVEIMAEENPISEGLPEPQIPLPRSYGVPYGTNTPEKRSWPELEGLTAEEAEKKIKEEMPNAVVRVIPQGHFVTMDFRTDRVRIFVDSSNKVVRPPMIG